MHKSDLINISIAVPSVTIDGDPEMHVESGSSVTLRCVVSRALVQPTYIFWYRDDVHLRDDWRDGIEIQEIGDKSSSSGNGGKKSGAVPPNNADNNAMMPYWGGAGQHNMDAPLHAESARAKPLVSLLTIREASGKHSGRYRCAPDNLRPAEINLHVIRGNKVNRFNP